MNKGIKKITVAFISGALIFATTGCSIVSVNTERDENQIVAVIGDTKITKKEALAQYAIVAAQYGLTGSTTGYEDIIKQFKKNTLDEMVEQEVIWQIAQKKGLESKLTDAEKTELDASYNDTIANITKQYTTDQASSTASPASTSTPTTLDAYIDSLLAEYGFTRDSYKKYLRIAKFKEMLQTEVEGEITDISDDDLKAAYDTELETQQAAFDKAEKATASTTSTTSYESYVDDGKVIVYVPSGLAYYKHILIQFSDSIQTQISALDDNSTLTDAEKATKLKELQEQGYAEIQAKADEALGKVKAGENFDTLIATYGKDPGMTSGTTKDTGYLIGSQTSSFIAEFKDACLALKNVGDTSELVKSDYGYHIIKKVSILTPGVKSYDEVKTALKAQVLEKKKSDHWDSTYESWKKELGVTVDYNKIY